MCPPDLSFGQTRLNDIVGQAFPKARSEVTDHSLTCFLKYYIIKVIWMTQYQADIIINSIVWIIRKVRYLSRPRYNGKSLWFSGAFFFDDFTCSHLTPWISIVWLIRFPFNCILLNIPYKSFVSLVKYRKIRTPHTSFFFKKNILQL